MSARILIVEDESIVALDLRNRLEALGYEVVGSARSAARALELARGEMPDLVLMDINLQGEVDGIDVAETIQSQLSLPVVFLTAFSDSTSLERATEARAYGYLLKPFHERELTITIQMALYKHAMEGRLADQQDLFAATLRTVPEGVVTADGNGRVMLLNPAAEFLTGWSAEDAAGQPLADVVALGSLELEPELAEEAVTWRALRHRDGELRPVEVRTARLQQQKSDKATQVVLIRDVAALLAKQRQLVEARVASEAAARAKASFLARISHELKTPLNSIIGMAEVTESAERDGELKRNLRIIASAGRSLARMVESLLDFAQVDAAGLTPVWGAFDPVDMSLREARRIARDAVLNDLAVSLRVEPDVPTAVRADRRRIEQVLDHLLSNAIKFTASGSVVLAVSHRAAERTMEWVVRDTGRGIPDDRVRSIFESFSQAESVETRSVGGTGIGLAVVHRLVSALGGSVDVDSEPEVGTTVTVRLPYRVVPAAPALSDVLATAEPEAPSVRLYAADAIISDALEPWITAAGGEGAATEDPGDATVLVGRPPQLLAMEPDSMAAKTVVVVTGARPPAPGLVSRLQSCLARAARVVRITEPLAPVDICDIIGGSSERLEPLFPGDTARDSQQARHSAVALPGVLVVDDDDLNRIVLRAMLEELGHEVVDAADAVTAIERLRENRFSALFTDLRMPDVDGLELTRRIRRGEAGEAAREVRIVAVSAYDEDSILEEARAAGVDRFLVKPISSDELVAALAAGDAEWDATLEELRQSVVDGSLATVAERAREIRTSVSDIDRSELLFRLQLFARKGDRDAAVQLLETMTHARLEAQTEGNSEDADR